VALARLDDAEPEVPRLGGCVVVVILVGRRSFATTSTHVGNHGSSGIEKEQPQEREKEVAENL
jgi:hypothetical protein